MRVPGLSGHPSSGVDKCRPSLGLKVRVRLDEGVAAREGGPIAAVELWIPLVAPRREKKIVRIELDMPISNHLLIDLSDGSTVDH
jgi:hypothetical protein